MVKTQHIAYCHREISSQMVVKSCQKWFETRVFLIALGLRALGLAICLAYQGNADTTKLALVLQYTTETEWIQQLIKSALSLTSQLLRAKKFLDLGRVPQENYSGKEMEQDWPKKGSISFQQAQLRYQEHGGLVLKDLSFEVQPGARIGIVGRTGAGKSTLACALSRLVELSAGKIEIDGVDISELSLATLRKSVTCIPQEPCLLAGTLRFNIDPLGEVRDAQIEKVVRTAGLEHLLLRKQNKRMLKGAPT